ncbi:CCL3 protein, partial [Penelope pileata]|nr:CCL3 protein [Penelope pileata]
MKGSAAVLAALLLLALCSLAMAHLEGVPTSCCISYVRRPIPRNRIATVYTTSSSCANPGVM